jgi:hypothetical protein
MHRVHIAHAATMLQEPTSAVEGAARAVSATELQAQAVYDAASLCSDLRFVSAVASLVAALRRPWALGNCILLSPAASAAVVAASAYLRTTHVTLTREASSVGVRRQLLDAMRSVLQHGEPVLVAVEHEAAQQPHVMLALQACLLPGEATPLATPAQMLQMFEGDVPGLIRAVQALAPEVNVAQVCLPGMRNVMSSCLGLAAGAIWIGCCKY